jgi:O-succinylbenzoate synthase
MQIESIRLYHLSMPLVSPFETSFGRQDMRDCLLVEVMSAGLHGWGECPVDPNPGYSYETTATAWHILKDFLCPAVVGRQLEGPQAYRDLVRAVRGHPMAKSALEMALWDLVGQRRGVPLRELLGGVRQQVEVGVSVGLQDNPQSLTETVAAYLTDGYRRVKLKIKPGRDVSEVAAVRKTYPDLRLQVDANSAYNLETAQALLPLDDFGLLLIEQPLSEDDLWDHHRLQRQFQTPICLDESIVHPRSARQALEIGACRVINIKQARVGGLLNALEIHDLCRSQSVPVWCGGMLETGIGRAANLALAALPNFTLPGDISATERYYRQDITQERFTLNEDSTISVPAAAGLGIRVDRHALAEFTQSEIAIFPE